MVFVQSAGGKSPLMEAVWWGSWSVAQLLLDRCADASARMENGFAAFMHLGHGMVEQKGSRLMLSDFPSYHSKRVHVLYKQDG